MTKYSILIETFNRTGTAYVKASVITLENNKPRNLVNDWDSKANQFYLNLCLQGHIHNNGIVSHGIEYIDVLSIDYDRANKMAKTLKTIGNKIAKMEDARVSARSTFEQQLLDFATAIKAEFIVTYDDHSNSSSYDDSTYKLNSLQHGAYVTSDIIDKLTSNAA